MNDRLSTGGSGFEWLTAGAEEKVTGSPYFVELVLNETSVIESITFAADYRGDQDICGKTLLAGARPMRFTQIKLTSGSGMAYKA